MIRFRVTRLVAAALLALAACQSTTYRPADGGHEAGASPVVGIPAKVPSAPAAAAVVNSYAPVAANAVVVERMVNEPTRRMVKLANGLTVILQQNRTAPVVACQVYIKAGSLTEQEYMGCGLSHVLEHLLVTGTQGRKVEGGGNMSMVQSLGGDANAFTSYDQTCFHITTITAKWKDAMTLLAGWTTTNEFTQADFDREYKVVQREIEMGEAEAGRTFGKVVMENRYLVNPARFPVIGFKPAFQKLTCEDARIYYKRMYVPDNMFVCVAGDIDLDEAEKFIAAGFSHMNRQKTPSISLAAEPEVTAPRTAIAHADVKEARVAWAFPGVDLYNPDMYALDVLAGVLSSGDSSVLVRTLRDEKGLVTGIGAGNDTPHYVEGSLEISASLAPSKIDAAKEAVVAILQNVLDKGVDPKEVEKVKQQTAVGLVFGNQTAEQQADRNGADFLATGSIDFSRNYVERIKAVTPEEVNAAARKYIKFNKLITTILLPKGAAEIASAGSASQSAVQQDVKKVVLGNGLTVLLCRNPSAPIVSMQMYTLGALLAEDATNNGIGTAMMRLMDRGSKKYPYDDITTYFDNTGGSFGCSAGNNSFSVSAECLKENADKTFDIFSDVALNPAFDKGDLERIRPLLLAAVDRSTEDWAGEAMKFARSTYYAQSPYKLLGVGSSEVISKLSPEDIRKHYEMYFRNPQKTVLAIYGDIDVAKMEAAVQKFGEMPRHEAKLATVSEEGTPGTYLNPTKKQSATVIIGYGPGMTVDSKDRDAMMMVQTVLGGYSSALGSPLFETLRGKGLVYTVQAGNSAGPVKGMFMVIALGEPGNADEIVRIITQIIDDTKAGKLFTEEAIAKARDQAITGQQLQAVTIADKATAQALDELMGLGYDNDKTFAARMKAVTREDMIRVANEYLTKPVITITTPNAPAAK